MKFAIFLGDPNSQEKGSYLNECDWIVGSVSGAKLYDTLNEAMQHAGTLVLPDQSLDLTPRPKTGTKLYVHQVNLEVTNVWEVSVSSEGE